ncbi:Smc5-Smc6 complex subunit NSE3 ASCRUDRAFT_24483, partial [Ascoidea rubescens DSM 1968]
ELIYNGYVLLIVSIVSLSNNNMNQTELVELLKKHFGIEGLSSTIEGLNLNNSDVTLEDLLKALEKNEYLFKSVIRDDMDEVIEYSIGRRAKAEFPKESMVELVRFVYGL